MLVRKTTKTMTKMNTRTVKALFFGLAVMVLFMSPGRKMDRNDINSEASFRYRYSKMYLQHCRQQYEIIYNDENRGLDELTANDSR